MRHGSVFAILGVPVTLALAALAFIYVASEQHIRSFPSPPPFSFTVPDDTAAIERGLHLVQTRGCAGCHGSDLAGQQMWGYAVAPNLPALAREESAATLEAAIRHGISRDGTAMYSMPSYNFLRLNDADLADILAYLRSQPVIARQLPEPRLPWMIRAAIALGRDDVIAGFLDQVPALRHRPGGNSAIARGEYIAMTTCNECHGFDLHGEFPWGDDGAPDLVIVSAYGEDDFRAFMQSGIALGGRELEMMSNVARTRFAHFTPQEVGDLYAFLQDMAAGTLGRSDRQSAQ
jgi:mono/diheme cytochrome c family protein